MTVRRLHGELRPLPAKAGASARSAPKVAGSRPVVRFSPRRTFCMKPLETSRFLVRAPSVPCRARRASHGLWSSWLHYGLPLAHKSLATRVGAERHRRDGHAAGFELGHSTRPLDAEAAERRRESRSHREARTRLLRVASGSQYEVGARNTRGLPLARNSTNALRENLVVRSRARLLPLVASPRAEQQESLHLPRSARGPIAQHRRGHPRGPPARRLSESGAPAGGRSWPRQRFALVAASPCCGRCSDGLEPSPAPRPSAFNPGSRSGSCRG
jgi:hypothetical protein